MSHLSPNPGSRDRLSVSCHPNLGSKAPPPGSSDTLVTTPQSANRMSRTIVSSSTESQKVSQLPNLGSRDTLSVSCHPSLESNAPPRRVSNTLTKFPILSITVFIQLAALFLRESPTVIKILKFSIITITLRRKYQSRYMRDQCL